MVSPPGDPACWWSIDRHARHRVETREGGVDRVNGNGEHSAQPPEAADSATERLHLADRLALRPEEAAEAVGVCVKTLRKWMRNEGLPYLRLDNVVLIPRSQLDEWMAARVESEHRADELAAEILKEIRGSEN